VGYHCDVPGEPSPPASGLDEMFARERTFHDAWARLGERLAAGPRTARRGATL
jgi:hypothetical protein